MRPCNLKIASAIEEKNNNSICCCCLLFCYCFIFVLCHCCWVFFQMANLFFSFNIFTLCSCWINITKEREMSMGLPNIATILHRHDCFLTQIRFGHTWLPYFENVYYKSQWIYLLQVLKPKNPRFANPRSTDLPTEFEKWSIQICIRLLYLKVVVHVLPLYEHNRGYSKTYLKMSPLLCALGINDFVC